MNCGHCGCAMVAEIKKKRYVYYHCSGYKGKCAEPYVREEIVSEQFSGLLGRLSFGDEVLSWVTQALLESHADEQKEHEAAIGRLQNEYDRLRHRLHAMYVDKLDGRIDASLYDQMSEQWRGAQDKIAREIVRHQAADRSYLEEGVRLIELGQGAQRLFAKAGALGTTAPSKFRTIELDLEGWRAYGHVPTALLFDCGSYRCDVRRRGRRRPKST